jgi:hypothetical protein
VLWHNELVGFIVMRHAKNIFDLIGHARAIRLRAQLAIDNSP